MERVYALNDRDGSVVYRLPGHRFEDGREDSDLSPIWLPSDPADLPEGVNIDDLRKVTVDK